MTKRRATHTNKFCDSCGCDPCDCDWGLYEEQTNKQTKNHNKKKDR